MDELSTILAKSQLPVIQRVVDNTAMSTYMACPREFLLSMIQHHRRKGAAPALHFGKVWHRVLEVHYRSDGMTNLAETAAKLLWKDADFGPDEHRTLARLLIEYSNYVKHYGSPKDEANRGLGRTVGSGAQALVEMSTNAQGDMLIHPWAGKLDRIVEINGLHYVEDHKTTSRFDKHYFSQFELANQMMGYVYLAKQLMPSLKIVGVRINLLHLLKGSSNFIRQLITFSPDQIEEWAANTNSWLTRLAYDWQLHVEGAPEAFPAHFGDNGCSRKFGLCQFHEVCKISRPNRHRVLDELFEHREWNPLELNDDD